MSQAPLRVYIEGVAFWFSRLADWQAARAVIRAEQPMPSAQLARPAPTLLAPTERRRAPDTVAVALEVATRACEAAGRRPSGLASVFASTHGDVAISDYMCSTLASTPTLISPIKFHNSVHNAAAGYWSIGTHSYASYTAVSAHQYTFGAGLLEAATQAICECRPVLYVAFDIEAKGPLSTMAHSKGVLGTALLIAPERTQTAQAELRLQMCAGTVEPTSARSPIAALIAENALAPCLPVFEALAQGGSRTVTLALSRGCALQVDVLAPVTSH